MNVDVGDMIVISCSGVETYYRMVVKHPDGGGEFSIAMRDGTDRPDTPKPLLMTHEELTSSNHFIDHYIPY